MKIKCFTVYVLVGECKPLNTALTMFAWLNYGSPCYCEPQNKLDGITQQIIG